MDHAMTYDPFALNPTTKHRPRPQEKGRDPYDGLRPWSAITHGVGAVLAMFATALLLFQTARMGGDPWKVVSFSIYGASMICLYTASTLYHCVNTSVRGRVNLRKYDHTSIYFLIAGTYTPICLTVLRGPWGWSLFGVI
jgi:hemolysin III